MESLRDIGYALHTAVSDVIDNSLTAGARTIELLAETHTEVPAIGILDDGDGMTEAELLEAMRRAVEALLKSEVRPTLADSASGSRRRRSRSAGA